MEIHVETYSPPLSTNGVAEGSYLPLHIPRENPTSDERLEMVKPRWEIAFSEIQITKELGRGNFGVVYLGKWRNADVAGTYLLMYSLSPK